MEFSERTAHSAEPNAITIALEKARDRGPVLDLTLSNPTIAKLPSLLDAPPFSKVATPEELLSLPYAPDPRGRLEAREAVCEEIAKDGARVAPADLFLTASTSEAYSYVFTALADPGDEIIVLTPSYPLLEYLARFSALKLVASPLAYDGSWHIDLAALKKKTTRRTRAIVVISPNNPTGSYLKRDELDALLDLGVPLVCDEVFSRYAFTEDSRRVVTVAGETRSLVFSLGGLSKLVALPDAKLAWVAVAGERAKKEEALRRIELVADTYLSVSGIVQRRASELLHRGAIIRDAIKARTAKNLALSKTIFTGAANALHVEGGWTLTLRVPRTKPEETWAIELLEQCAIYTHPGRFFDFDDEAYLALSLLVPEEDFARGIRAIADYVEREA